VLGLGFAAAVGELPLLLFGFDGVECLANSLYRCLSCARRRLLGPRRRFIDIQGSSKVFVVETLILGAKTLSVEHINIDEELSPGMLTVAGQ
jgi:hypothetical protein